MEIITFASTSNVLRVKLLDSASTVGAGKTGLSSASAGLIISTIADNEATATTYTQAGSTIETITTLGTFAAPTATKCRFKEIDATNLPGWYELQLADARFAVASSKRLGICISGASGMVQLDKAIELKRVDLQDAVRAGLAALRPEWVWLDPTNGTASGTGTPGDPVATITQAYALGNRIKFVPAHGSSGGGYSMPVIDFTGGLSLDLNGWVVTNAQNGTFPGFERITSSLPGGRLVATGTLTMGPGPYLSHLIVEAATFTWKYGYAQDVFFNVGTITHATHNFGVRSDFYTCWFNNTGFAAGGAFGGGSGTQGHHFNLLGCYGELVLSGLKNTSSAGGSGQKFTHLGWGALSVDGTGGTVEHTSHVEIDDQSAGLVTLDLVSEPTPWNDDWDAEFRQVLGAATVQVNQPVDPDDATLTLIQGDDHLSGDRLPTWPLTGYTGPSLAGATGKLRLITRAAYRQAPGSPGVAVLEVTATVTQVGTDVTVTAALTAAQTTLLASTGEVGSPTHDYQVIATTSGGAKVTLALGTCVVRRHIPAS